MFSSRRIGSVNDTKEKKGSRSCNCKRSSCLKLYCECFANGSYCHVSKCNCNSCHNNAENNHIRKAAIESTLDRNPHAFRSKIHIAEKTGGDASTKHHKGCHCKKSNCLKKYCECFQGGVVCSEKCRCLECRNFSGSTYRQDALHRAQLKEKHGEGDSKNAPEHSNHEDKTSVEGQHLDRPRTSTLLSKQSASSILNERNVSIILQSLINSGKSQKRKYENMDESHLISTGPSESILQSEEISKIVLIENFIATVQDIVSQSLSSNEGHPIMSQTDIQH